MRRPLPAAALAAAVSALALGGLTGCSGPRIIPAAAEPLPVPTPVATPSPVPAATPTPAVALPTGDWRDWNVTPGDWVYRQDGRGSIAMYGRPGQAADFTIRCDRSNGRIIFGRHIAAAPAAAMAFTVRTSSMMQELLFQPVAGEPYVAAMLGPRDPLLDAMGFSRGRFIVEGSGLYPLVLPAWAEVHRVVEDCRK
ncbi:hypothetical protein [Stakelama tenebrarum]|uniref:Lipoprotein n=1 Tax=Stakelama tenebrarum TaxID=2711215 RepID=A0A6G6Y907_9SPHN|nr:hypothetical protein [Sphingosinithalassobacter tenebrarum]QIG81331.1 hypothetical protein G5C33_17110 [Sphingosinithalassobacter tenebrarum]